MDISIERVKKMKHPLLVIGLGGSGANMVRSIKDTFAQRYELPRDDNGNLIPVPEKTAYLVFDTDRGSSCGFDSHEFKNISLPGLDSILDPKKRDANLQDFERRWVNKKLNAAAAGLGAGTYRQTARFMLGRNIRTILPAISNALQGLCCIEATTASWNNRVNIVICTGLCGGTGSGIFLDIAQLVRLCMRENPALNALAYKITGYLVMPDVSLRAVSGIGALESILKCNAYAALKELDFWMRVREHKTPYTMQYDEVTSTSWTAPPFDTCVMLSGETPSGTPYTNAYQVMLKTVADNLLHYFAEGMPSMGEDVPYTYISYEDHLKPVVTAMRKRLPLFYGYRAIGSYTKRIPKKKMLYYEGSKVFDTFLPPRDEEGRLVPNRALRTDGKSGERAAEIVGSLPELYNNFQTRAPLPPFCNAEPNNAPQLEILRTMTPLPHERTNFGNTPWLEATILLNAMSASEHYLEGAWERFTRLAQSILTDPELGPFSLLEYLTVEKGGLMPKLKELEDSWGGMATNFAGSISAKLGLCQLSWPDFVRPPLLIRKKSIALYLLALQDFYDIHRKHEFVKAYGAALSQLIKRIEEYIRDSLQPLCDDLLELAQEFASTTAASGNEQLESDIFPLSSITDRIDADFAQNNADGRVSKDFLRGLGAASMETMGNVDAHSSGVSFTYKEKRTEIVVSHLRSSLERCFAGINDRSLDAIMVQTAGQDLADQQKYMDQLGESVLESAKPMFAQNPAFASETAVKYSYLSVPCDAPEHFARFDSAMAGNNVCAEASSIRDHLYCSTVLDGLPLYRYNQMDALENTYWNMLSNPSISTGLHLVWDGELDSDYTRNWTKLPSPCPYYFFAHNAADGEKQNYQRVRALVDRAIASGMLEVDATKPEPVFHLKQLANKTLFCDQSPTCLAAFLGLANQPCDPFDEAIQENPALVKQAQENHLALSREMAAALIARDPMLVAALEGQLGGA